MNINHEIKAAYEAGQKAVEDMYAPVYQAWANYWEWHDATFAIVLEKGKLLARSIEHLPDDDPQRESVLQQSWELFLSFDRECVQKSNAIKKLHEECDAGVSKLLTYKRKKWL